MNEEIQALEKQLEFSEKVGELKNRLENMLVETCYKFEEEFRNWDKLQEEFSDEHDIDVFLEEVIDEVLQELGQQGIVL